MIMGEIGIGFNDCDEVYSKAILKSLVALFNYIDKM